MRQQATPQAREPDLAEPVASAAPSEPAAPADEAREAPEARAEEDPYSGTTVPADEPFRPFDSQVLDVFDTALEEELFGLQTDEDCMPVPMFHVHVCPRA